MKKEERKREREKRERKKKKGGEEGEIVKEKEGKEGR